MYAGTGDIARFMGIVVRDVWTGKVFGFFGETLRQAGILIIYSTLVIWSLVFITGLGTCGIEAAYFNESTGTPAYFVHPTEASHGDLGAITREDVLLLCADNAAPNSSPR